MAEYQIYGAQLGWLIDPENRCTYIYTNLSESVEQIPFDAPLSGGVVLPGFQLTMADIFSQ